MNVRDIHLLYEYNYWTSKKILAASACVTHEQFTAPASFPFGGLQGTLLHILEGEWSWRALFQNEEEVVMRAYLAGLTDEGRVGHFRYTTDTGFKRDRILWHCLFHVVNHGAQHRSEPAALLTGFGRSPGDLDFTVFLNKWKK